jgi:pyroglutamyl-peptidase
VGTVVVTGFQPFDGLPHNPSAALLALLPARIGGHAVRTAVLPVDTVAVMGALDALPGDDVVLLLHLGLAQDRAVICAERVALNLLDFGRPDNAGNVIVDREVVAGGPLALPARLPVRAIAEAWKRDGLPGALSSSAGTFLCNQVFYTSLAGRPLDVPVGFIHLPPDEVLGGPVPLAVQARAVVRAIEVSLTAPPTGPTLAA